MHFKHAAPRSERKIGIVIPIGPYDTTPCTTIPYDGPHPLRAESVTAFIRAAVVVVMSVTVVVPRVLQALRAVRGISWERGVCCRVA